MGASIYGSVDEVEIAHCMEALEPYSYHPEGTWVKRGQARGSVRPQ